MSEKWAEAPEAGGAHVPAAQKANKRAVRGESNPAASSSRSAKNGRIVSRTIVETIEAAPKRQRSREDSAKVSKAARELITELRAKRDSLPHGI